MQTAQATAWQWIPLLCALFLDLGVEITGFAVHAFAVTPLARLLYATSVYIWLLDLLNYLFKREPGASAEAGEGGADLGSLVRASLRRDAAGERLTDEPLEREGTLSVKQLRLLVSSPFRVDTPKLASASSSSSSSGPVTLADQRGILDERVQHHPPGEKRRVSANVGPVIRRASRLPSWLGLTASSQNHHRRAGSGESADAILSIDVEQQAGPAALPPVDGTLSAYYAAHPQRTIVTAPSIASASLKASAHGRQDSSDPSSGNGNTRAPPSDASMFGGRPGGGGVSGATGSGSASGSGSRAGSSRRTSRLMHTNRHTNTHTNTHTKGTPSIASTSGTYNDEGIRLDSPIEVAIPCGGSSSSANGGRVAMSSGILSPAGNARVRQNLAIAGTLAAMEEEEDDDVASPLSGGGPDSRSWSFSRGQSLSLPTSASGGGGGGGGGHYTSSSFSTPIVPPSLFSRQSALSLSYFPRPPSTSAPSRTAAETQEEDDRHTKTLRRKQSVRKSANGHLSFGELEPPRMPAAVEVARPGADGQYHGHAESWGSRDTFTGSEGSPEGMGDAGVVIRGFNVTSYASFFSCVLIDHSETRPHRTRFIGAPSLPEPVAPAAVVGWADSDSLRSATMMRASSLSRTNAKLLCVSSDTSSNSHTVSADKYLAPAQRSDSLKKGRKATERPQELRRNTSDNAAAVQEVTEGY